MSEIGDRKDNQKLSDIFITSVAGVASQLKRFFPDRVVPVVQTTGTNHFRALFTKNKRIKKPFFAYSLLEMETNMQGYNPYILHKRGRTGANIASEVDNGPSSETIYNFMPVTVAFKILFVADDISDVYALAQRWLIAARNHYLDFIIDVEGQAEINVKSNMDQRVTFPDFEFEEIGESITIELNMSIDTYQGSVSKKLTLTSVHLDISSVVAEAEKRSLTNLASRTYTGQKG